MTSGIRVEGLEEAVERLNKQVAKIKGNAQAGLWEAGLKILASAQRKLRASVVTGNLRASGYVRSNVAMERPMPEKLGVENEPVPSDSLPTIGVELGFTANYALYVHEDMEGRSPKFLEQTILENESNIVAIVKKRADSE